MLVVKLHYSTYISQLWSGDSNQISKKRIQKGGKRSYEGFIGMIIFAYSGQGTKPKPRPGFVPWPGLPVSWSSQVPAVDSHYAGCVARATAGTRARDWQALVE